MKWRKIIKEFVGLRAKLYSLLTDNGKEIKKDKGIKKSVVKKQYHLMIIRNV